MGVRVLSREIRKGTCEKCEDLVYDMVFVKDDEKKYYYMCLDCAGEGTSKREKGHLDILEIDEDRLAREEVLNILLEIAEADEEIFKDPRLTVVNSFKEEIVEGVVSKKLERYIKFNDNNINFVLNLRSIALEAKKYRGKKFNEVVKLYISSRIRKLTKDQVNRVKVLLTDKEVQMLNDDYKLVWENIYIIKEELIDVFNRKRYDNAEEILGVLDFGERKGFYTDFHMRKLKAFYYEMVRRNRNRR